MLVIFTALVFKYGKFDVAATTKNIRARYLPDLFVTFIIENT